MTFSRKLDAWIAENIFGNEVENNPEYGWMEHSNVEPTKSLSYYTSDMNKAIDLLTHDAYFYEMALSPGDKYVNTSRRVPLYWEVTDVNGNCFSEHSNPAMAICMAAYYQVTGDLWHEDNH